MSTLALPERMCWEDACWRFLTGLLLVLLIYVAVTCNYISVLAAPNI